jgi:alpha-L-fucosidase 2
MSLTEYYKQINANTGKDYSGGNPKVSKADALPGIREWIFQNGTGNVSALLGEFPHYGSYQVLANLTVDLGGFGSVADYRRRLDLPTGVYGDRFCVGGRCVER